MKRISVEEAMRQLSAANISNMIERHRGVDTNLVVFAKGGPYYWDIFGGEVDADYLRNVLA